MPLVKKFFLRGGAVQCFFWFVKTFSNSPQELRDWMDEYAFFHGKWWW